jgi:hypothetical protein
VCSNKESRVRELMKFEMREQYSNKMYKVGKMVGIKMKYGVGEQCSNMEYGVRELIKFKTRELYSNMMYEVRRMVGIKMKYGVGEQGTMELELELWRRWYRASPKGHHP